MSLILEALKKLEREKRSSEPGFLVLGPTSWPSATGGVRRTALALAGFALLATALAMTVWRNAAGPAPADTRAAAVAAPPASSGPTPWPPPTSTPGPAAPASTEPRPPMTESMGLESPRLPVPESPASEPTDRRPEDGATRGTAPEPAPPRPNVPPAAPEAPQPRFRLQAISLRDGKPVAVLNDRLVYEGETFDGVSVVRIGEAEVELEVDGRRVLVGF